MKYVTLRNLLAVGSLDWEQGVIMAVVLGNYTFDEDDANLHDMQLAGATVLSLGRLSGNVVTDDGWAASESVLLPVVQSGGPYDVVLFLDSTGDRIGYLPLVCFPDAITTASNGDVVLRPDGVLVDGTIGNWFRF